VRQRLRVVIRGIVNAGGARLVFIEQPIEIRAIEDQARALAHRDQVRPPLGVERTALDAHVGHGFGEGESALHGRAPATSWASLRFLFMGQRLQRNAQDFLCVGHPLRLASARWVGEDKATRCFAPRLRERHARRFDLSVEGGANFSERGPRCVREQFAEPMLDPVAPLFIQRAAPFVQQVPELARQLIPLRCVRARRVREGATPLASARSASWLPAIELCITALDEAVLAPKLSVAGALAPREVTEISVAAAFSHRFSLHWS
jgi:hypothetical protein